MKNLLIPTIALSIVCISSGIHFLAQVVVPLAEPEFLAEVLDEVVRKSADTDRREHIAKALAEHDQRQRTVSKALAVITVAAACVAFMSLRRSATSMDHGNRGDLLQQ